MLSGQITLAVRSMSGELGMRQTWRIWACEGVCAALVQLMRLCAYVLICLGVYVLIHLGA